MLGGYAQRLWMFYLKKNLWEYPEKKGWLDFDAYRKRFFSYVSETKFALRVKPVFAFNYLNNWASPNNGWYQ